MGESYGQLAAVSAVLGGFAVTFLSIVLTLADDRRRVAGAVGLATTAAACFFLTTLGWALLAAFAAQVQAVSGPARLRLDAQFRTALTITRALSALFLLGVLLLTSMLAAGGWLRSRRLGIFTTAVALLTGAGALAIIRFFVT
jgi:hypothetical protein